MTCETSNCWVVHSPNESAISNDGAGFWSNEFGWVPFDQATRFSTEETGRLRLPFSTGGDARFVPWQEALRHYG
ncbi:hypothetical protein QYG06_10035 [Xanthomonas euvesicatoria]|uniref:Uncharacterized protein n=3 Tax=Lysobacterales TaxID=135614 RepID=Q3BSY5_XANE5|nr:MULTISPECIES: hypothetical protein [Pseudomonadota]ABM41647.1 conserved hypothetical protein [Acidovorax sp. JS42]AOY65930.1 hypothetical protein BHE83_04680 [Xanthomonas euvesicatoria pv. vesicatoria str. 85-10]KLB39185.1 hypothetical protein XEUV206_17340 [Xanthomonas euvesicatoria]MCC8580034.1 hypothetical protein [Xanthomonas euvesicatoria pv. euvesicatoria]MCC8582270.1 hypothetical protein [Xanthomonas euvesicatoria pv. euvesicatoria]